MAISRFRRHEERVARKRLVLAAIGTLAILVFLAIFGLKILIGFSLLVDRLRGGSTPPPQTQTVIQPPSLDPWPEATNSARVSLSGQGQPDLILVVFVNEREFKKLTVPKDGRFTLNISLPEGSNIVSAKHLDEKGNPSQLSNVLTTLVKTTPSSLEIDTPGDGETVSGEKNIVTVSGKTDEETQVTINGRLVVVRSDGTFAYDYPLALGENRLTIVAVDRAGNQTIIERRVTYQK